MELDKIMNEPATRQELENKLSIINTLLPNSEGFLKALRLHEKEKLEIQLALFDNVGPEDEIIVNVEDEGPRTYERDTFDIRDVEIALSKHVAKYNENNCLDDRHKFTSSLYREETEAYQSQNPMEGIFLGLAGTY